MMASDHSNHGLLANNTNLVDDFEEAFQVLIGVSKRHKRFLNPVHSKNILDLGYYKWFHQRGWLVTHSR